MNLKKITCFLAGMLLLSPAWAQLKGSGSWTWMKGTDTTNKNGIYGTKGVPAPANNPGGRDAAGTWTDTAGKFWLFGGQGRHATTTTTVRLNDLWKYDPATNEWTWVAGDTSGNVYSVFGQKGVPDPANKPGGRYRFTTWTDANGNFWLFGGLGRGASGAVQQGVLNDLWKYTVATGLWTWVGGHNAHYANGVYAAKGLPDPLNMPGAREGAAGWTDKEGNLWLYGGIGRGGSNTSDNWLSDLWKYDPQNNVWTWVHGDSSINVDGLYGALGVSDPAHHPGGRRYAVTWTDTAGNLWLFSGQNRLNQSLNDLWKYNIAANEWTWMHGDSTVNQFGIYGVPMVSDPANKPGSRISATAWQGPDGYFWMFGGSGYAGYVEAVGSFPTLSGYLNDLWLYNVATNEWTWVDGDSVFSVNGIYGTQGVPDPANKPGTRYLAAGGWKDATGDIWMFGGTGRGRVSTTAGLLHDLWRFDACFLLAQPLGITGADTVCQSSVQTYTIPAVTHADSYTWTLPAGWSGSSTSESITVTAGTAGGTISVRAHSDCDTTPLQTLDVFVPPFVPVSITVDSNTLSTATAYAAYQWYKGGDSVSGARDSFYVVTENGSYTVKVTDAYGCTDSSAVPYTVSNIGIGTAFGNDSRISLYPNPARTTIHVRAAIPADVSVISPDGRMVIRRLPAGVIDIAHLAAGVYVVQVTDPEGRLLHMEKLVKTGGQ